ncbi:tachykinin-like peptides receptor 86C [Oppia nitens]|uniref:tachykinin-like peptides receptor 86C n=1 Tax=Oppia nitens TaxID=1686743 RepID=UPI0023DB3BDF|nr:tachykinin-like peptides receptor 86C [Oppia nitens]
MDSFRESINKTDTEINDSTFQFEQGWQMQLIWSFIFGSMILISILGNVIIISIIASHHSMRTVTNYFFLNLTIADLLSATLNATFNYIFMLSGDWPFGHIYCVVNNFMANLLVAVSVFTITAISVDRYIAIVYPLKPHITKRNAVTQILIVWLLAILVAMPCLVFGNTLTITYDNNKSRTICLLEWPDGLSGQSKLDFIYNITFLLMTYIVPVSTMAIAYSLMARVLWGSQEIGEGGANSSQRLLIQSKQKVVRMLICVVSVFAICWLPYHSYFLLTYQWPQLIVTQYIQHIYLAIYWLAMSNAMFDPIILLLMNKRFRRYSTNYLLLICGNKRQINLDYGTNSGLRDKQTIKSRNKVNINVENL